MRILPCAAPPFPIEPAPLSAVLDGSAGWSCFWGADGDYYARRVSRVSGRGALWFRVADEAIVVEADPVESPAPRPGRMMLIGGRTRERRWGRLVADRRWALGAGR